MIINKIKTSEIQGFSLEDGKVGIISFDKVVDKGVFNLFAKVYQIGENPNLENNFTGLIHSEFSIDNNGIFQNKTFVQVPDFDLIGEMYNILIEIKNA